MRELDAGHYLVNLSSHAVFGPIDVESTASPERVLENGFYWLLNALLKAQAVALIYMDYSEGYNNPVSDYPGIDIDAAFWGVTRKSFMWYMYDTKSRQVYGPYNGWAEAIEDVAIKFGLISVPSAIFPVAPLHYTAGDKAITRADHWGTAYNIYLDGPAPHLLATVIHTGADGLGNPEHDARLIAAAGDMFQFISDLASLSTLDGQDIAREAGNLIRQVVHREVY
jgi:hypothetical protein